MDKRLKIKELAAKIGVTEDTVINWETRGMKPRGESIEKLKTFLENKN